MAGEIICLAATCRAINCKPRSQTITGQHPLTTSPISTIADVYFYPCTDEVLPRLSLRPVGRGLEATAVPGLRPMESNQKEAGNDRFSHCPRECPLEHAINKPAQVFDHVQHRGALLGNVPSNVNLLSIQTPGHRS